MFKTILKTYGLITLGTWAFIGCGIFMNDCWETVKQMISLGEIPNSGDAMKIAVDVLGGEFKQAGSGWKKEIAALMGKIPWEE